MSSVAGFDVEAEGPFEVMGYVVVVFFLCDVVLNFRTAFENPVNKTLVTDAWPIAKRYLSGWFLIDLISSIPFEMFIHKADNGSVSQAKVGAKIFKSTKFTKAIKIVRLLKLTKLARTVNYIHELEDFIGPSCCVLFHTVHGFVLVISGLLYRNASSACANVQDLLWSRCPRPFHVRPPPPPAARPPSLAPLAHLARLLLGL
jgi:hypothetical protein